MVTANLNTPLMVGETGNTLTCDVSGADALNLMIIWIRKCSTQIDIVDSGTLSLSPLRLSDAGDYSCNVTSTLLSSPVAASNSQMVIIQSKPVQFL